MLSSTGTPADERTDEDPPCSPARHRVVIVGGGFGGLEAAKELAGAPVDITLIDQRNYHLFQPLLYQVATASLATSEIAWPIRALFRGRSEVRTLLAKLVGVDTGARRAQLDLEHAHEGLRIATLFVERDQRFGGL